MMKARVASGLAATEGGEDTAMVGGPCTRVDDWARVDAGGGGTVEGKSGIMAGGGGATMDVLEFSGGGLVGDSVECRGHTSEVVLVVKEAERSQLESGAFIYEITLRISGSAQSRLSKFTPSGMLKSVWS
jgi:hypothetical protein